MTPHKSKVNHQRKSSALLAFMALCLSAAAPAAMAACEAPNIDITMPDGEKASVEEMNRAQNAVTAYVAAGEAYIKCVDKEQGRNQAERMRNNMLDDMEEIAGAFNRQLRVYKRSQS